MKVKICGITHPDDAAHAAFCGADYIGINFSKSSRRFVTSAQGTEIASAARQAGAEPVALFVDETLDEILSLCAELDIRTIQLHNPGYLNILDRLEAFTVFFAVSVYPDGSLSPLPPARENLLLLFDCPGGGTGISFDWSRFCAPSFSCWMLAGGLRPENVRIAIDLLKPGGVDAASGVEYPNSTRKEPSLVEAFIQACKMEHI